MSSLGFLAPAKSGRLRLSAIPLYDAEPGDIRVDNGCDVNARGETLLVEFVAARVGDWLAAQPKARR